MIPEVLVLQFRATKVRERLDPAGRTLVTYRLDLDEGRSLDAQFGIDAETVAEVSASPVAAEALADTFREVLAGDLADYAIAGMPRPVDPE